MSIWIRKHLRDMKHITPEWSCFAPSHQGGFAWTLANWQLVGFQTIFFRHLGWHTWTWRVWISSFMIPLHSRWMNAKFQKYLKYSFQKHLTLSHLITRILKEEMQKVWYITEIYSPGLLICLNSWLLNSLKCSSINWDVLMIYHDHDKGIIIFVLFKGIYESHCYLIDYLVSSHRSLRARQTFNCDKKGYYSYQLFN